MELTAEQLEAIKEASREIEFGKVTVNFAGNPHNAVTIAAEKHVRFHSGEAVPTTGTAVPRNGSGRY